MSCQHPAVENGKCKTCGMVCQKGVCRICGCTDRAACILGSPGVFDDDLIVCSWADATETLCTNPKCLAAAGGAYVRIKTSIPR
jgi:hypothetical protein